MEEEVVKLHKTGAEILNTPLINKGTGFTDKERDQLGLTGLLPPKVSSLEQQIKRSYLNFSEKKTPLEKYDSLAALLSRNELLFYQFASRYPSEILPFIYTPTVGDAAMHYSRIYFHQRGLYLSHHLKDRLDEIFENYNHDEIDVIVVTDGERILGLGDQGIGGMTIPIGKLSLYTLFAGIHPARTLPIILDVGTNNQTLLNDELYLGCNHTRLTGSAYDDFLEKFIRAVRRRYPKVLLQWEDFGKSNARRILDKYRDQILSFNDDIQGTAAVTLGALFSALRISNQTIVDQKVVILGGGSAGTGIADAIVSAMVADGLSYDEACKRIYIVDVEGLIYFGTKNITKAQEPFVHTRETLSSWPSNSEHISFLDVITNAKPTALIGVCAQGGAFTQEIIEEMAKHHERPIIFPLSNPTLKAECTPEQIVEWTKGKAIFATGSPFPPVEYEGKTYMVSQCNNVYIFPGIGLGALGASAEKITDGMFLEAARTLAKFSPALNDPTASLFPPIDQVRKISKEIARAVAKKACEEKVAKCPLSKIDQGIEKNIWDPHYPKYRKA
ncbi:MAG: NAD-dependent malic enzyme [Chlamydiae bacterium CG10_big_fil_rev_8_21_14_0_10_42_34]|nr:MAG: NAD-dependent malic enzyme [Chlamydiae bacterium CG10_big_fil_rev_8_21_14_0_10_42_34]